MAAATKRRVVGEGAEVRVQLGPLQLKAVDEWRQGQLDQPSRSEAIRRLLLIVFTLKAVERGADYSGVISSSA